jgi:hypothetical protein
MELDDALVRLAGKTSRAAVIGGRSVHAGNEVGSHRLRAPAVDCVAFGQLVIVDRRGVAQAPATLDRCVVHAASMLWHRYAGWRKPRTASFMRTTATMAAATSCILTIRAPLVTQMTASERNRADRLDQRHHGIALLIDADGGTVPERHAADVHDVGPWDTTVSAAPTARSSSNVDPWSKKESGVR